MKHVIHILLLFVLLILCSVNCSMKLIAADEYPNSVYIGLGLGQNVSAAHTEFSLMAGYDKHISGTPEFSLGLLLEGVFSEHSSFVVGVPIGFYPVETIKLWLAPCYSFGGGEKEYYFGEDDNVEYFDNQNEFTLKFGAGYNYHFHNSR